MSDIVVPDTVPDTHDYTKRYWGHDYMIHAVEFGGTLLRTSGWGKGLKDGDFILLQNGASSTRYKIDHIEYKFDPKDMWSAKLIFAPRIVVA